MMKRTYILLLSLLLTAGAYAQELGDEISNPQVRERVQAARVAYITDRLDLTAKESQQFWAINNEYEKERDAIQAKYKPSSKVELMSDAEVEQYLRNRFDMEAELLELKRSYFERFRAVVSARKIAMFQRADREFRLELLRKVRERKGDRRGRMRN
jgi:hypothetical protein